MLILSDDKSAYAQFSGLIEALNADVSKLIAVRDKYMQQAGSKEKAQRFLAYKTLTAEIGAYNSIISLIRSTDIMRMKVGAPRVKHMHVTNTDNTDEEILWSDEEVQTYLTEHGARNSTLWEAFIEKGISLTHCEEYGCKERLAKTRTAQNS